MAWLERMTPGKRAGRKAWLALLLIAGMTSSPAGGADKPTTKPDGKPAAAPTVLSPEDVLREFLIALTYREEKRIRAVIVDVPEAVILWKASPGLPEPSTPPALARVFIEARIRTLEFKRLQPGDEVKLPGGQTLKIDETRVNADRLMLTFPDNPVPFIVVRQGDDWKVDAGTIIAARKRAEQFLRENPEEPQRPQQ